MLFEISFNNIFLDMSPHPKEIKTKTNKWDYIKLKSFLHSEGNPTKQKGRLLNGRRYLQTIYLIRG